VSPLRSNASATPPRRSRSAKSTDRSAGDVEDSDATPSPYSQTPTSKAFRVPNFPYHFDSLLQVAVDFESSLEPADSRMSGAQCEMLIGENPVSRKSLIFGGIKIILPTS
jgi:hypothetical protein